MRQTLRQARKEFCPDARKWAQRYTTLPEAWEACPNGHWMAWWLMMYRDTHIRNQVACDLPWAVNFLMSGLTSTVSRRRQLAKWIRARYDHNGKTRRLKVRR